MDTKYKPSLGETVRVVECKWCGNKEGFTWYRDCPCYGYCNKCSKAVSKLEPVEKKQLPSERINQIFNEYKKQSRDDIDDDRVYAECIVDYLDEQHIAGREK